MVVGVLQLTLYVSYSQSLKEKRAVLRKIKSRVRNEFNVSISECGDQDLWQRTLLGICQVGTEQAYIDGVLHAVVRFIDELHVAEIGEEKVEFLHY
ncbi:MAG: DUF503 domain-containing protein [Deltaproteobacteria bacterium]|nr:DUF503 domain-containing protein [Deltaproteobacteria bacterium]